MDERSGGSPAEARQRWRIVFRHEPDPARTTSPETVDAWVSALSDAGLPIATSLGKTARARIAVAAPLPAGSAGEAEVVDIVLTERLTRAALVASLEQHLPPCDRLVELFDVWLGEPTLTSRLAAADYRLTLGSTTRSALSQACAHLLDRTTLPRSRPKGDGRVVDYDLRPLLIGLEVSGNAGGADDRDPTGTTTLRMRLRLAPDAASGRPDEVILALGEELGSPLVVERVVRERMLTVDDLAEVE